MTKTTEMKPRPTATTTSCTVPLLFPPLASVRVASSTASRASTSTTATTSTTTRATATTTSAAALASAASAPFARLNERLQHVRAYAAFTDEFELDPTMPYEKAMIAGASAGVMEHFCMFPIDTIKTRLQVLETVPTTAAATATTATTGAAATSAATPPHARYTSIVDAVRRIHAEEGLLRLYRGVGVIVAGAIPSHALNYAAYEALKHQFGGDQPGHHPLAHAAAGSLATLLHDAVTTPLDVVKQRLQMYGSTYTGVWQCVRSIVKEEGFVAFYASYPTTVMMNVPFMTVHFAGYEAFKRILTGGDEHESSSSPPSSASSSSSVANESTTTATDSSDTDDPQQIALELVAGGMAGGCAGLFSTPFDVVKTRVQTQHATHGTKRATARDIAREIWRTEGVRGFFRGASARVLYFIPSATICWGTYEAVKRALKDAW